MLGIYFVTNSFIFSIHQRIDSAIQPFLSVFLSVFNRFESITGFSDHTMVKHGSNHCVQKWSVETCFQTCLSSTKLLMIFIFQDCIVLIHFLNLPLMNTGSSSTSSLLRTPRSMFMLKVC